MGVYIKGMEMPKSCRECYLFVNCDDCEGWKTCCAYLGELDYLYKLPTDKRHDRCPLVPVPPHGRLIEADRLKEVFHRNVAGGEAFDQLIDIAPTIIQADEEVDNGT